MSALAPLLSLFELPDPNDVLVIAVHQSFLSALPKLARSIATLVAGGESRDQIMAHVRLLPTTPWLTAAVEAEIDYLQANAQRGMHADMPAVTS